MNNDIQKQRSAEVIKEEISNVVDEINSSTSIRSSHEDIEQNLKNVMPKYIELFLELVEVVGVEDALKQTEHHIIPQRAKVVSGKFDRVQANMSEFANDQPEVVQTLLEMLSKVDSGTSRKEIDSVLSDSTE